jgi:murein L,D-transpeptidase YafK
MWISEYRIIALFLANLFLLTTLFLLFVLTGCAVQGGSDIATPFHADYIVVEKTAHRMTLFNQGRAVKTYTISLGQGGLAPKRQQGDQLTPEGLYYIAAHNPDSHFHNALLISYPNAADQAWALAHHVPPGGEIMIHGSKNGLNPFEWFRRQQGDWTNGCIAVRDADIDAIAMAVPDGTPIDIKH